MKIELSCFYIHDPFVTMGMLFTAIFFKHIRGLHGDSGGL